MLGGANVAAAIALAQAGNPAAGAGQRFRVIVSGGVASLDDVRRVKAAEAADLKG